jgi:arsenate reductase
MKAIKLLPILFLVSLMFFSCNENAEKTEKNSEDKSDTIKTEKAVNMKFYPEITKSIEKIQTLDINKAHMESLDKIAAYIRSKQEKKEKCEIVFICTHNSRRSHLAQIWAQAAAENFELNNIVTYSGGTEATAFNPRAVTALQRAGFKIDSSGAKNPKYTVRFSDNAKGMDCFSKKYSDPSNPQKGFLAVMVCDSADEACPLVAGAEARVSLPFSDPKKSDGTPEEAVTYDSRSMQIAAEMFYIMSKAALK